LTTIVAMVVALNPDIQAAVFSSGPMVFGLIRARQKEPGLIISRI
jgi:hypothetical protein